MKCTECKFFKYGWKTGMGYIEGNCLRYPPQSYGEYKNFMFPIINDAENEWCGEFKPEEGN